MTETLGARDRAWRRAETRRIIANRLRFLRKFGSPLVEHYAVAPHRLARRHPFDCGRPQCGLCSPWKRDQKARQATRAWLLEAIALREA